MPEEQSFLTREKFSELQKELDYLKTTRRKEIAESLEYTRSLGDLSENAEYQEAREMQAATEERIGKLESIIKSAKIVSYQKSDIVSLGSTVVIQKEAEKETHQYQIVGSEEADMREKKISYLSPLGEALMGKKKGDSFTFVTPNGKMQYSIISVESNTFAISFARTRISPASAGLSSCSAQDFGAAVLGKEKRRTPCFLRLCRFSQKK